MEELKKMAAAQENIRIEGFGIKEARELKRLMQRFIHAYSEKAEEQSDEAWLKERFMEELPEMSEDEADRLSHQTMESIREYNTNRASLEEARQKGIAPEQWFAAKVTEATTGIALGHFNGQIAQIDKALEAANDGLNSVITTQAGNISQNINLDGFLAEEYHVATFNAEAAMSDAPFYAERCARPGQPCGLNSFDVVIKDRTGKIMHQYQSKYGADAGQTIRMIRDGNYNNQTLLVPPEQVERVKAAFPGKTVVSTIGGTDKVSISSKPLSKEQVKLMQLESQEIKKAPEIGWNTFDSRSAVLGVGKRAFLTGMQGAALSVGFQLAAKAMQDEPVDTEEVVGVALQTGMDTGVKAAVAGAVKTGVERGIIGILPPGTPMHTIANIVCVGVENIKILAKITKGEITLSEGLDKMGCNTVAMTYGLGWSMAGAAIGTAALSWIPVIGPIVGGVCGGCIGYMAGSKFGEKVYEGVKKATKAAKEAATTLWNGVKKLGKGLMSGIGRLIGLKKKESY